MVLAFTLLVTSWPVIAQEVAEDEPQGIPQFLEVDRYRKALAGLFHGCTEVGFAWYWAKPRRKSAFYLPVFLGFDEHGKTKAAAIVLKPRQRGKLVVATGLVETPSNEFLFSGMHMIEQDNKGPLREKNYRGQQFFTQFREKEAVEKLRLHGNVDAVSGATPSAIGLVNGLRDAVPWLKNCISDKELNTKAMGNKVDILSEYNPEEVIAQYDKPLPRPRRRRRIFGFLPWPF